MINKCLRFAEKVEKISNDSDVFSTATPTFVFRIFPMKRW